MVILRRDGTVLVETGSDWDLSERDLREADFRGAVIEGGNFSDAYLRGTNFSNSDLYGTYLYRADCRECNFTGALLRGVVLDEAIFSLATFKGARLLRDNMGKCCSLCGADLRTANLTNSDLTCCQYDSTTLFPVDFDPGSRGMIRVD
jgi:uncharacterized protein YjbI with pentapeptide repeats